MHSIITITLAMAVAAIFATQPARAIGITAYSGTACNGVAGNHVPCDGSCHSFETRHSFRVSTFVCPSS